MSVCSLYQRACVRVCVCARACVCMCVCVRVCQTRNVTHAWLKCGLIWCLAVSDTIAPNHLIVASLFYSASVVNQSISFFSKRPLKYYFRSTLHAKKYTGSTPNGYSRIPLSDKIAKMMLRITLTSYLPGR